MYVIGKRTVELIETITKRDLPHEFNGIYEWPGGQNTLQKEFVELGPDRTLWKSTCEYSFSSFPLKLMGVFLPGMFRKQNMMFLENFEAFAEHGRNVNEGQLS